MLPEDSPPPFTLPDEVNLDYDDDGDVADVTARDCVDDELVGEVQAAWAAFHPGEPLPPAGTAAEFNQEYHAFNEALREAQ